VFQRQGLYGTWGEFSSPTGWAIRLCIYGDDPVLRLQQGVERHGGKFGGARENDVQALGH
jgi:hypothetical protein